MNKILNKALVTILFTGGLMVVSTGAANAATAECIPADAWTETVTITAAIPGVPGIAEVPGIPAIPGTPAVPAIPAVAEIPGVPAVAEIPGVPAVAEIPEVSHSTYQKYVWDGRGKPTTTPPGKDWGKMSYKYDGTSPTGIAFQHGGHGDWYFWVKTTVIDQAFVPGIPAIPGTPGKPAIPAIPGSPEIPGTPAVAEVPAVPGTPAVAEIPAVPAVTKDVIHAAVTCEVPPVVVTPPAETPVAVAVAPVAAPVKVVATDGLAETGGSLSPITVIGGLGLLAGGMALLLRRKFASTSTE